MTLRLSFKSSDIFWNCLIDTPILADPVQIPVNRPSPTTRGVRPVSLFVHIKLIMGTGIISELIVLEIGGIKEASVQTPILFVGKYAYTWDPH
jgi:hypothetical protein